jgi:peptidoglycan/xylan/chitin deacetylase (PgdA/CDA1 family)
MVSEKNRDRLSCNENMKVSPSYLEWFIIDAKSKGYSFISLSDLKSILDNKGMAPRKSIIITLDDGYRDNLTNGFPIFEKHKVPFVIYLSTFFIENRVMAPWWYVLEELLLKRDEIFYKGERRVIDFMPSKEEMFLAIRDDVLSDNISADSELVNSLCRDNNFDASDIVMEDLFLSWPDIEWLSNKERVEMGNHGHKHVNLNKCDEILIKDEFGSSSKLIYEHTGKKPTHYSYPYGFFDNRSIGILESFDAHTAVTTNRGVFDYTKPILQIPRFMLCEGMSIDDLQIEAMCSLLREMF